MPEPEQPAKSPISPEQLAHIGELIAGGAMLVPTDEQVRAMSQQAPTSEWGTVTQYPGSTGEPQPVNSAELTAQPEAKTYTDESIKELIDSTYFATHNYFGVGGETNILVSYGENAVENIDTQNEAVNYAADLIKYTSDYKKENSKKFDEVGSPEVVTLLDPRPEYAKVAGQYAYKFIENACLGLGNDRQKVNGELVKAILYTTSADQRGKYQHYDPHSRGGVRNEFCLVLPASQADSLFAAMQADPLLVRRFGDAMSLQALNESLYKHGGYPSQVAGRSPEQVLADSRPPYDEWQAINDGVNRMSFRTSYTHGPEASNIVTFDNAHSTTESSQPSAAEAIMTNEMLDQIVADSISDVFFTKFKTAGNQTLYHSGRDGTQRLNDFQRQFLLNGSPDIDQYKIYKINKAYVVDNVAEVVTVEEVEGVNFFGNNEPFTHLRYKTLTQNTGGKFSYPELGKPGARENVLYYGMFIPKSQADPLLAAMKADPTIARTLADKLIANPQAKPGSNYFVDNFEDWPQNRPPYEQWRQQNDGVARMAFQAADIKTIDQATIVDF